MLGIVLAVCCTIGPAVALAAPIDGVAMIVGRLQGLGAVDRAGIERAFGRRLVAFGEPSNPYFDFWRVRGIAMGPVSITHLELREPKAGVGATGRAILLLTVGGGCVTRQEIEQRFGPLTPAGVPRGRSLDEQSTWIRQDRIGRLGFGFPERSPDCLRTITLNAA